MYGRIQSRKEQVLNLTVSLVTDEQKILFMQADRVRQKVTEYHINSVDIERKYFALDAAVSHK